MTGTMKVIACATVSEELLTFLPPDIEHQTLDFGLHIYPDRLRRTLQEVIDGTPASVDTIILGYGLCAQALVGIRAGRFTLVIPRVHDCIALFLGSHSAFQNQMSREPGTYFLTKGWIEVGDSPFSEYERLCERYGQNQAEFMTRLVLKNYTRLALINTGQHELERYRAYTRNAAERFALRYEEIPGSTTLLRKMIFGPWDTDFVVIPPEGTVRYESFWSL